MTTKEQERAALAKIRKICEGLEDDSYINIAFRGVLEDAADNIDNDFANSWKCRAESANARLKEAHKRIEELEADKSALAKDAIDWKQCAETIKEKNKEANKIAIENWNKYREQEDKVAELEMQIIKLKARLFDMMEKAV